MTAFSTAFSSKPSRLDFFSTPKSAEQGGDERAGLGVSSRGDELEKEILCHAHIHTLRVGASRERLRILFFGGPLSPPPRRDYMSVHSANRVKRRCDEGIARMS